ncbi:MAG TPA: pyridoxamine 5'-phosphate oxidase family protein [Candidatus Limnocylindria bacterium]|nr:pyridoxamine 5'-phosphate oxidase family protein [Candidatus Limnocylindria bacterium]
MLGTLDRDQIERVLHAEVVGRIGVHADGRTYVVPVSYVYDGDAVYVHSLEGLKVRMLRAAKQVCFEVDHIRDLGNWQSVIAWGRYEELAGDVATAAMNLLASRLAPVTGSETAGPSGPGGAGTSIAFRIRLDERTGRYEKS